MPPRATIRAGAPSVVQPSREPFIQPIERTQAALAQEEDRLAIRAIGQTVVIPAERFLLRMWPPVAYSRHGVNRHRELRTTSVNTSGVSKRETDRHHGARLDRRELVPRDWRRARLDQAGGTRLSRPAFYGCWSKTVTGSRVGRTFGRLRAQRQDSSTRTVAKRSVRPRGPARRARFSRVEADTLVRYVESSAVVAALLEHDMTVVKSLPPGTQQVTSALTLAEAGRAIVRALADWPARPKHRSRRRFARSARSNGAASFRTWTPWCSIAWAAGSRSNESGRWTQFYCNC